MIDLTDLTGGVSDYTKLTNQPQINGITLTGNKSSEDLNIYLPNGYTINVATDGTGDFTDIQSAINSLQGKLCAGNVTINVASGTYTVTNQIFIGENLCANLVIKGNGISNTIINITNPINYSGGILIENLSNTISIVDLALINTSDTSANKLGLSSTSTNIIIKNVKFQNWKDAIDIGATSRIKVQGTLTVTNCTRALHAEGGGMIYVRYGVIFDFNNVTTALTVTSGGYISCFNVTKTFTNVTNLSSQTIGTMTTHGYIGGIS